MIRSTRLAVGLTTAAVVLGAGFSTAYAAPAPAFDVQANSPQIAHPLGDTTGVFPNNKQNEPTIAVSPDGVHLVAGANDEQEQPDCGPGPRRGLTALPSNCSFFDGVGTDGVYVSSDGGRSWTNTGLIDRQAAWLASPFVSDGDPVVAFGPGPDGRGGFTATSPRVYYQSLASYKAGQSPFNGGFGGAETIVVSHSDDFGLTWSAPAIAGPRTNPITFNDKNAMAVDDNLGSPFYGRVYSSWTSFRSATATGNGNEPVLTAYSPDGGATFSAPKQLSPAANNGTGNGRQGSAIATTPDGTAMVAFEQGAAQVVAVSRDGGTGWSRPGVIGPVADILDPIPGATFRTNSFASLSGDPSVRKGGVAYASWVTRTATGADVVLYKTVNHGVSWAKQPAVYSGTTTTGYPFFQGMDVAPNGRVDLAWQALKAVNPATFGTGNASIDAYYTGGGPFRKVSGQSSDPAVSAQNNLQRQFWGDYSTLVSTSTTAWFISTDSRNGVGCPKVDAYQRFLVSSGAAIQGDERQAAAKDAAADSTKPAPPVDCLPAAGDTRRFGDTDAFVAVITP